MHANETVSKIFYNANYYLELVVLVN